MSASLPKGRCWIGPFKHRFERNSVVRPAALTEHALRYAAGSSRITEEGLDLLIKTDERFLWSKTRDRLTTRAVAAAERQIISMVEEGIGKSGRAW